MCLILDASKLALSINIFLIKKLVLKKKGWVMGQLVVFLDKVIQRQWPKERNKAIMKNE